jgi:hypothetical protein
VEFLFLLFVLMPMLMFGPVAIVFGIGMLDVGLMLLGSVMTLVSWSILFRLMERRGIS